MEVKDLVEMEKDLTSDGENMRIKISKAVKERIEKEVEKSKAVVLKIDNLEDSQTAATKRGVLNTLAKNLEDKRLEFGRKITKLKKGWDSFFNDMKEPAVAEVRRIGALLKDYQAELNRKQAEAEAKRQAEIDKRNKLQAAHAAKGHTIDETPREALVPEVVPAKVEMAAKMRTVWKYEIQDESRLPREYLSPDPGKIYRAVTRKEDPVRDIPGVRIWSDSTPA